MKKTMVMVLLLGGWFGSRAQFLGGFFDQAATQLQLDGQQLAALQAYTGQLEQGYKIVENGIADIGAAKGGEYSMHEVYFASLAAVNPSVAGMPEVQEILTVQAAITTGFSGALDRWQSVGNLKSVELDELNGLNQTVSQQGQQTVQALTGLVTGVQLTMTDDQRISRIRAMDEQTKKEYGQVSDIVARTDLLVLQRQAEQGNGNVMGQVFGLP